jgi:hypothetical protein
MKLKPFLLLLLLYAMLHTKRSQQRRSDKMMILMLSLSRIMYHRRTSFARKRIKQSGEKLFQSNLNHDRRSKNYLYVLAEDYVNVVDLEFFFMKMANKFFK